MNTKILLVIPTILLSGAALAEEGGPFYCSHGDLERRVEVVYETGGAMPCQVQYHKDTEAPGEPQILWTAQNELGYCEERASEFVGKLEEWGWDCATTVAAADESAQPEVDDTEELAPAEEAE